MRWHALVGWYLLRWGQWTYYVRRHLHNGSRTLLRKSSTTVCSVPRLQYSVVESRCLWCLATGYGCKPSIRFLVLSLIPAAILTSYRFDCIVTIWYSPRSIVCFTWFVLLFHTSIYGNKTATKNESFGRHRRRRINMIGIKKQVSGNILPSTKNI